MRKTVLVTGSSRGIGASIIGKFARNNFDVIINYLNSENEALSLQNEIITKYNVRCETIKCDISKEEEVINMAGFIKDKFGKIDVLVNNAGICNDMILDFKTYEDFKKVVDVNLNGTFIVTKYISKLMKKGSIVNISSTNGIDTYYPESIDYDASKAGVISLTHNFAKIFAPKIRVNAVCPGWVETDQNKELSMKQIKNIKKGILLKRFAKPEEIANVVFFVANDSYINNTVIRVDGGSIC